jgi:peptidoglycan/LPS O-acetylase OafA/YrhL
MREPAKPVATGRNRLVFLDQLRGIAIILVFLYHSIYQAFGRDELTWNGWTRNLDASGAFLGLYPITWGWCGVAIFFALSGFSIHLSHTRASKDSIGDYFARRWFRIYPPFLVALLFFALVFPRTRLDMHSRWGLGQFFSHLLLVHNLNAKTEHGIATAWWSIAVEFQLYLLYPLLLIAVRKIGWRGVLIGTAVVELGLRFGCDIRLLVTGLEPWVPLRNSPFFFWYSWTIGAAIADAYLKGEPLPFRNQSTLMWLTFFVFADMIKPLNVFSFTLAAVATATAISRFLSRPAAEAAERRPLFHQRLADHLRLAGLCSYSIYLIHHPIVEAWPDAVNFLLPSAHQYPLLMYVCCLSVWLVIFPISWLIYRLVELPAIGLGRQLIESSRRRRASAVRVAEQANV